MGRNVVAAKLRAPGMKVEVHADHFADDEKDEVWLAAVGKRGWVVISKDDAIRRRETERRALIKARVRAFFLASAEVSGPRNAEILLKARSRIEKLIRSKAGPMIVLVRSDGSLDRDL
jgi:PIN like domain